MDKDYTKEQEELLNKPVIIVYPSFNDEWVIEVRSADDELSGRFNAPNTQVALEAISVAMTDRDEPPHFEIN